MAFQRFSNPLKLAKIVFMSFFFGENSSGFHHEKGPGPKKNHNLQFLELCLIYIIYKDFIFPGRESVFLKKKMEFLLIKHPVFFFNEVQINCKLKIGNGLSHIPSSSLSCFQPSVCEH